MGEHDWSGWPGAWCLHCGTEDKTEHCEHGRGCEEHRNGPCPESGSNRFNPYKSKTVPQ